jgi:hypothetical protein
MVRQGMVRQGMVRQGMVLVGHGSTDQRDQCRCIQRLLGEYYNVSTLKESKENN